jgi:hypothetical protein
MAARQTESIERVAGLREKPLAYAAEGGAESAS